MPKPITQQSKTQTKIQTPTNMHKTHKHKVYLNQEVKYTKYSNITTNPTNKPYTSKINNKAKQKSKPVPNQSK